MVRLLSILVLVIAACDGGGRSSEPAPTGRPCRPTTCAAAGAACGAIVDGCGGRLECGDCSEGETCGGGGAANTCGVGTCEPASCGSLGANCGQVSDGCAAVLDCGRCEAGRVCGGDGVANVCGCAPATCAVAGAQCGTLPDGCGGTLECGRCGAGETCGGGGVPNVCGPGSCEPQACAGASCGTISDGCGGTQECGDCGAGETCGGGGVPNVCGSACSPRTCAAAGATCGSLDDGCGGNLACGVCDAPLTCGGGGIANTCGAACTLACPGTYACSPLGVCTGGDPTQLVFDVRSHQVSGVVTMNGQQPSSSCSSVARAYIDMVDETRGYHLVLTVPCDGATTPFTFSGAVYPGTYRVLVRGHSSSLPTTAYLAIPQLVVQGDVGGLALNVQTHRVGGVVTMNGQQPSSTCSSVVRAFVDFREATLGHTLTVPVPCNGATTPFAFDGFVYPGTYQVLVRGGSSSVPSEAQVVLPQLTIGQDRPGLVLDVRTRRVSGVVTMNGQQPTSSCSSVARAHIDLQEMTLGYNLSIPVPCNGATTPFTFDGLVYPGTYRVRVRGTSSNLPIEPYVVLPQLTVQGDVTNLALDVATHRVSGVVTMNGQRPTSTCSSVARAHVDLREPTLGYTLSIPVPCNGATTPFVFDGFVYPGTYRVTVRGASSNLPSEAYVVAPQLTVSGALSGLAFDVVTHRVSGVVTMNGVQPTSSCSSVARAQVELREPTLGYNLSIPVPCNGATTPFSFDGFAFPGTYEVRVRGSSSNIPSQASVVVPQLPVSGQVSGLALDVVTHRVTGVVTMNGQRPTSTCSSVARAHLDFLDAARGYNLEIPVPCNGATTPFTFDGLVYPGTYEVRVRGHSSSIPGESYLLVERIAIP